ncbi:MAG: hypothetical protein WAO76_08410 [Georgfuchsia sp.]
MCPKESNQRGFAIVSAIFLLVVLAALGGFIATISTTQHIGSALDVSGAQAYQAARAGTEWGLARVTTATPLCDPGTNIGTVSTMAVTVTCTTVATGSAVEIGLGTIYSITATACNMPSGTTCPGTTTSPNYVERQITVLIENPCGIGFPACS